MVVGGLGAADVDVAAHGVRAQLELGAFLGRGAVPDLQVGGRLAAPGAGVEPQAGPRRTLTLMSPDADCRLTSPRATLSKRRSPEAVLIATDDPASRTKTSPDAELTVSVPSIESTFTSPEARLMSPSPPMKSTSTSPDAG